MAEINTKQILQTRFYLFVDSGFMFFLIYVFILIMTYTIII